MEENKDSKQEGEFISYEEARIDKEESNPVEANDREVNAATDLLNLDEETRERG